MTTATILYACPTIHLRIINEEEGSGNILSFSLSCSCFCFHLILRSFFTLHAKDPIALLCQVAAAVANLEVQVYHYKQQCVEQSLAVVTSSLFQHPTHATSLSHTHTTAQPHSHSQRTIPSSAPRECVLSPVLIKKTCLRGIK